MTELHDWSFFANGSGAVKVAGDEKFEKLRTLRATSPRTPEDFMKLLAIVNRRVAAKEATVSPFCQVSFLNADQGSRPITKAFVERGEAVPFDHLLVADGMDLGFMFEHMLKHPGVSPDASKWDEVQRRRP
jgi:hypothetical protein